MVDVGRRTWGMGYWVYYGVLWCFSLVGGCVESENVFKLLDILPFSMSDFCLNNSPFERRYYVREVIER